MPKYILVVDDDALMRRHHLQTEQAGYRTPAALAAPKTPWSWPSKTAPTWSCF
ncbi:MAG: hypothetical protein M5U34_43500 [Chloroflexi bacterium]|nr:hypothetical protein [Chloroflexota bacterium]